MRDLEAFLRGSWRIERTIIDRRRSICGNMGGQADFTPAGAFLNYQEAGLLKLGSHSGSATQHYVYDFADGPQRALVRFRDGRPFHHLDLSSGEAAVAHACAPDSYEGRFTVHGPGQWRSRWTINGPAKDQQIVTLYTRLG